MQAAAQDTGDKAQAHDTSCCGAGRCTAFAAGLFVATLTLNLAIYAGLQRSIQDVKVGQLQAVASAVPSSRGLFAGGGNPYDNIVRIDARYGSYSQAMPWQMIPAAFQPALGGFASGASASGVILGRGFILTAAYVATDSILVTATRQGDARKYVLTLVAVARELDVAIFNVKDARFWRKSDMVIEPSRTAPLPALGTEVIVAGFPQGSEISVAKVGSRISRIETEVAVVLGRYNSFPQPVMALHPQVHELVSVGPVFCVERGAFVGFVALNDRVVPERTIATLLASVRSTGAFSPVGQLGLVVRPMRPPGLRKYWGLPADDVGVQVRSVAPDSPLFGRVQDNDVLVAVAGQRVHADGAMKLNVSEGAATVLPFQVLLGERAARGPVRLTFRRAVPLDVEGRLGFGNSTTFEVEEAFGPLQALLRRAVDSQGLQQPSYFIAGGLVWSILTEDLVKQSDALGLSVPSATLAEGLYRWRANPEEEVVVLLRSLEHSCNKFYDTSSMRVLKFFNDEPVVNLKSFAQSFGDALRNKERFLRLAFAPLDDVDASGGVGDPDIVLDAEACAGADLELTRALAISSPASPDLADLYKEAMPREFVVPSILGQRKGQAKESRQQEEAVSMGGGGAAEAASASDQATSNIVRDLPWANVVQVTMTVSERNFISPWHMGGESAARCSGIIVDVEKRVILTNSHCVASSEQVSVQREDFPNPVAATVVELARDVDLAWITTDDPSFWANPAIQSLVALDDAGLPYLASSVRVVGYPTGGSSITITEGIVSRLDGQIYPNGLAPAARNTPDNLPIVQVDAAINHGNSGGPAFDSNGRLLGLAFCALSQASNVGYIIPSVLLSNFLLAVRRDGRWQAQPEVGVLFRRLQNAGIRGWLQLRSNETGLQVRSVSPLSPLHGKVQKGDVLLRVDGKKVDGEGTLKFHVDAREVSLPFAVQVTQKALGENTSMEFLRVNTKSGERQRFFVTQAFRPIKPLVARFDDSPMPTKGRERFAAEPVYFVFGAIVWGLFSMPAYLQALDKGIAVPWSVQRLALHQWLQDDEEVIVILRGLPHRCTQDYDLSTMRILRYFNGKPVKTMKDFVQLAGAAAQANEDFLRFTFQPLAAPDIAGGVADPDIVVHRASCGNMDEEVIRQNGIPPFGVSSDLRASYLEAFGLPAEPADLPALSQNMPRHEAAGVHPAHSGDNGGAAPAVASTPVGAIPAIKAFTPPAGGQPAIGVAARRAVVAQSAPASPGTALARVVPVVPVVLAAAPARAAPAPPATPVYFVQADLEAALPGAGRVAFSSSFAELGSKTELRSRRASRLFRKHRPTGALAAATSAQKSAETTKWPFRPYLADLGVQRAALPQLSARAAALPGSLGWDGEISDPMPLA